MQNDPRPSDIEIQTPCPKSWDSLVGDERKRFCSECNLHVHNSAALTRNEASELVSNADGRVCMRIVRDQDGTPIYVDSNPVPADEGPVRATPRLTGWLLAAGAGLFSACAGEAPAVVQLTPTPAPDLPPEDVLGSAVPNIEILGEVVCPEPDSQSGAELGKVAVDELLGAIAEPDFPPTPDCESSDGEVLPECTPEVMGRVALPDLAPDAERSPQGEDAKDDDSEH